MLNNFFLILMLFAVSLVIYKRIQFKASLWSSSKAHGKELSYLTAAMAVRPGIVGHPVPIGYRLLCLYFGSGLVDRTLTLDHGFPVKVIDQLKLPAVVVPLSNDSREAVVASLSKLCLDRASQILTRAREENRPVRILWSGGIDSTAAAVALLRVSNPQQDRLQFYYSKHSVSEYKKFFREIVSQQDNVKIKNVADVLGTDALVVTGEHGDQLFGSLKALSVNWTTLKSPWLKGLKIELSKKLASPYRVEKVVEYITPLIEIAPVPIETLWDLLWWLNFSTKWQSVALRIPAIEATRKRSVLTLEQQYHLTEHFFGTDEFQAWALKNRRSAIDGENWSTYKWPLKEFIYSYNKDDKYRLTKRKLASLNNVMNHPDRFIFNRRSIAIDTSGTLLIQQFDTTLRGAIAGTSEAESRNGMEISFDRTTEKSLWSELGSDGE